MSKFAVMGDIPDGSQPDEALLEVLKETDLESFAGKLCAELQLTRLDHFDHIADGELESFGGLSIPAIRRLRAAIEEKRKKSSKLFNFFKGKDRLSASFRHSAQPRETDHGGHSDSESSSHHNQHKSSKHPKGHKSKKGSTTLGPSSGATLLHDAPPMTCLIASDQIKLLEKLGEGSFAVVKRAIWNQGATKKEVAIKLLRDSASFSEELQQEVDHMHHLRHPNLIRLYGLVFARPIMMVVELCDGGALLDRLRDRQKRVVLASKLVDYSVQISKGMAYLESKRFIHRDLATRNVLLTADEKTIKIGDFGLMRALPDKDEHYVMTGQKKVPFAWCPPESLKRRQFSHASDVWSFGVTLWEMFSYGEEPWCGFRGPEILQKVQAGERLLKPSCCPSSLYQLLLQCWAFEPEKRPRFFALKDLLKEELLSSGECKEAQSGEGMLDMKVGDVIIVVEGCPEQYFWFGQNSRSGEFGKFARKKFLYQTRKSNKDISRPIQGSFIHAGHGDARGGESWGNPEKIDPIILNNPMPDAVLIELGAPNSSSTSMGGNINAMEEEEVDPFAPFPYGDLESTYGIVPPQSSSNSGPINIYDAVPSSSIYYGQVPDDSGYDTQSTSAIPEDTSHLAFPSTPAPLSTSGVLLPPTLTPSPSSMVSPSNPLPHSLTPTSASSFPLSGHPNRNSPSSLAHWTPPNSISPSSSDTPYNSANPTNSVAPNTNYGSYMPSFLPTSSNNNHLPPTHFTLGSGIQMTSVNSSTSSSISTSAYKPLTAFTTHDSSSAGHVPIQMTPLTQKTVVTDSGFTGIKLSPPKMPKIPKMPRAAAALPPQTSSVPSNTRSAEYSSIVKIRDGRNGAKPAMSQLPTSTTTANSFVSPNEPDPFEVPRTAVDIVNRTRYSQYYPKDPSNLLTPNPTPLPQKQQQQQQQQQQHNNVSKPVSTLPVFPRASPSLPFPPSTLHNQNIPTALTNQGSALGLTNQSAVPAITNQSSGLRQIHNSPAVNETTIPRNVVSLSQPNGQPLKHVSPSMAQSSAPHFNYQPSVLSGAAAGSRSSGTSDQNTAVKIFDVRNDKADQLVAQLNNRLSQITAKMDSLDPGSNSSNNSVSHQPANAVARPVSANSMPLQPFMTIGTIPLTATHSSSGNIRPPSLSFPPPPPMQPTAWSITTPNTSMATSQRPLVALASSGHSSGSLRAPPGQGASSSTYFNGGLASDSRTQSVPDVSPALLDLFDPLTSRAPQDLVREVQQQVPFAKSGDRCATILRRCGMNVEATVKELKIQKLMDMGIAGDRNTAMLTLDKVGWEVNAAAEALLQYTSMETMEAIIDEQVDPEDLRKFRKQYKDQLTRGQPSSRAAFTYAHCLIRSHKSDVHEGVKILEGMLNGEEEEGTKREYIFYLAQAHTRLKNYDIALKYLEALLNVEPTNGQALNLKDIIQKRMKRDGLIGAAVLGGGAVVVGAIAAGVIAAIARR